MRYRVLLLFCCLFVARIGYGQSQTCTGSLGDPIRKIDFSDGNPIPNYTRYTYTPGTPNDGQYTIAKSTAGMFDWWAITDHTGNGYMMIINANESTTNYFYQQEISGLCPGTTYEFAAWIINLAKIVKTAIPDITFKITDDANNSTFITTGPLAPGANSTDWHQYAMTFTTPTTSNGTITLTLVNNARGGVGNDIALDDITFRPCGPVITSTFPALSSANASGCAGTAQSYTMNAQIPAGGYPIPMYQWQVNSNGTWTDIPGATTTTYTANFTPVTAVAGTYQYRMASANGSNISSPACRVVSNVLNLTISDIPSVTAPASVSVCEGQPFSLTLRAGADPNNTYTWTRAKGGYSYASANLTIPNVQLSDADTYTVTVKNAAGCTSTASTILTVSPKVTAVVAGSNFSICEGDNVQLSASGGTTYSWSPATGLSNPNIANPIASPAKTTTYTVTISNGTCSSTVPVTVTVTNRPVVNAGADQKMTEGQTITLNGSVDADATSYYWTPTTGLSDPNSLHPTVSPAEDITYTLHATGGQPCNFETMDDVFIRVYKKVVVPNTFTPNGDGINDTWNIVALETYPEAYTQVFNRLGRVVYQTHGYAKQWDGKTNGNPLPEGVYYYKIDLKPGTVLSGWVAIVR